MQALIVEFRIQPPFIEAFAAAIAENARRSREHEPGCRQFDFCRDPREPGLFFLYELYDDEAAVQVHLQSAHFRSFAQATAPWVQSKQVRQMERFTGVEP